LKSFDFNSIVQRTPTEECIYTRKPFYTYDFVTSESITPLALRMHCEVVSDSTRTLLGSSLPSVWITEGRRLVIKREGKFFYLSVWKINKKLSAQDIKALRVALSGDTGKVYSFLTDEVVDFVERALK
jgi:hypothetical protein